MSISPVQVSSPGSFGGSLTATTTLTGVAANNDILVAAMHGDAGGSGPTLSCSDAQATYTIDVNAGGGLGVSRTTIFHLKSANAGTHNISVVASGGTAAQSSGEIVAFEVPPVVLDQSNTGGGSGTALSVAATAALVASGDFALAAIFSNALNAGGGTFPPTGGTGTYTAAVSHTNGADCDYQTLTSTAGVGANWGTFSVAGKWAAAVAAYKGGAALAGVATEASSASGDLDRLAGSAAAQVTAQAVLTTAIQAAAAASATVSASAALTNWATVTLAAPLYSGPGGILDPNFWLDVVPQSGDTIYYDATNITVYSNGEISSTTNHCSAIVQFNDGTALSIGTVIIVPDFVSYAHILTAAIGALSTAITMAGVALSATSAGAGLTTGILLAGNAMAVASAAATLSTGVQLDTQALINVSASGALTGGISSLQGAANIVSQALAGLTAQIQLAGQVAVNSTVAGGLATQIVLNGAARSLTQANAYLLTAIQLAGNANVTSSAAGAALLTSSFSGAANAVVSATSALLTGLQVAGNALVVTQAAGDLSTGITLSGGAIVDSAAAIKPAGPEAQFGYATTNVFSPTGLPVVLAAFSQGSACIVEISYFDARGLPFIPTAVSYRVDDIVSGQNLVPLSPIPPALSNAITITGQQNQLVTLTRSFEQHQVLFVITDGLGNTNNEPAVFDVIRTVGLQ